MSVTYSQIAITARLQAVATLLNGGFLVVLAGSTPICTITLSNPSGTVLAGVFTMTVPVLGVASATGTATSVSLQNSAAADVITGLTVGIPLSGAEVLISNGLNTLAISASQPVQVIGGQIIGS